MAKVMGLDEAIAAGAVICGAYFGDKMTPLSETTILVPQLVGRGLTVGQHIRNMIWTAGPALGISLMLFFLLGLTGAGRRGRAPRRPRRRSAIGLQHLGRRTCCRWCCWSSSPS